jgi:AcrR family transcriptional regulator
VSEVEVVRDLIELECLAEDEDDEERRQRLIEVAERVAARDGGVKASEAAAILGVSVPTVRAWIDAGVLQPLAGRSPLRVAALSLAATKRAVDAIRQGKDDRHLLVELLRMLRDRAVISGVDAREGLEDLMAGRVRVLDGAGLDELLPLSAKSKPSKSR